MQSIWYERDELIFGSNIERTILLKYTREAFAFASAIGCPHVVFGNPKNRHGNAGPRSQIALEFFGQISEIADEFGLSVGIEPIPRIYQNTFLTTFLEVKNLVELLGSAKVGLNYDIGALIVNNEKTAISSDYLALATHYHISEPNLAPIIEHEEHKDLLRILQKSDSKKCISIEMLEIDIETFKKILLYTRCTFLKNPKN
jgi:sugar phosphate isomerase/epimerase